MDDFYVTLLSTSSVNHPNNVTSSFSNSLNTSMRLNSDYRVAVSELSIPPVKYINNVCDNNNKIFFTYMNRFKKPETEDFIDKVLEFEIQIPNGNYKSVGELVKTINDDISMLTSSDVKLFDFDPPKGKVVSINQSFKENFLSGDKFFTGNLNERITVFPEIPIHAIREYVEFTNSFSMIKLQNRLALILGYDPNKNILNQKPNICSIDQGLPQEMYLYCNIIEPQIIGHSLAPILRIIPLLSRENSAHIVFSNECLLKLGKHSFDSISIELRDRRADLISFREGYSSTVLLHFKREFIRIPIFN